MDLLLRGPPPVLFPPGMPSPALPLAASQSAAPFSSPGGALGAPHSSSSAPLSLRNSLPSLRGISGPLSSGGSADARSKGSGGYQSLSEAFGGMGDLTRAVGRDAGARRAPEPVLSGMASRRRGTQLLSGTEAARAGAVSAGGALMAILLILAYSCGILFVFGFPILFPQLTAFVTATALVVGFIVLLVIMCS